MGLLAGLIAVAGLLGGLALLVAWAGVLERWVDGADGSSATLDSMLSAGERDPMLPAAGPVASEVDQESEADRFVIPPAA